jgi:hypothetical protein
VAPLFFSHLAAGPTAAELARAPALFISLLSGPPTAVSPAYINNSVVAAQLEQKPLFFFRESTLSFKKS